MLRVRSSITPFFRLQPLFQNHKTAGIRFAAIPLLQRFLKLVVRLIAQRLVRCQITAGHHPFRENTARRILCIESNPQRPLRQLHTAHSLQAVVGQIAQVQYLFRLKIQQTAVFSRNHIMHAPIVTLLDLYRHRMNRHKLDDLTARTDNACIRIAILQDMALQQTFELIGRLKLIRLPFQQLPNRMLRSSITPIIVMQHIKRQHPDTLAD